MRRWAILLTVLVLAGCQKKVFDSADADVTSAPAAVAKGAPPAIPLAQLAYDYAYRLSLPAARIQHLFDYHQQACEVAGPSVCQVVGASMRKSGRDVVSAHLELRATPDWINHFRAGLDGDAESAGGQVDSANTAAEDLTRSMVDNKAGLKARTGLRDRLEKDVETHSGKLSEAVEAEKTVAEVQGDIDTRRGELAAEKTRVATSKLTLDYAPASDLATAFGGLGAMLPYLLPIALFGGLVAWIVALGNRKSPPATATPKVDDGPK